jgi:hypothetical protein
VAHGADHRRGPRRPIDPALVDPEVIELVEAKEAAILDGTLVVEVDDTEPKSTL